MGFFGNAKCEICKSIIKNPKADHAHMYSEKHNRLYDVKDEMNELIKNDADNFLDFKAICYSCAMTIKEKHKKQIVDSLASSNLIICPDCNKSISKRASACPNCGCPISDIFASTPEEVKSVLPESATINKPKCPTCGAINIEKISFANKAGSVALVGIFALGRVSKTFKCNNCGHKW